MCNDLIDLLLLDLEEFAKDIAEKDAQLAARDATIADMREEIAAAKLFGGGYFANTVTESVREYHRRLARRQLEGKE